MCKYCEKDKRKKRDYLFNSPILSLRIIKGKTTELNAIEILSINRENEIVKSCKIINYCPMCGRKLGDE